MPITGPKTLVRALGGVDWRRTVSPRERASSEVADRYIAFRLFGRGALSGT